MVRGGALARFGQPIRRSELMAKTLLARVATMYLSEAEGNQSLHRQALLVGDSSDNRHQTLWQRLPAIPSADIAFVHRHVNQITQAVFFHIPIISWGHWSSQMPAQSAQMLACESSLGRLTVRSASGTFGSKFLVGVGDPWNLELGIRMECAYGHRYAHPLRPRGYREEGFGRGRGVLRRG